MTCENKSESDLQHLKMSVYDVCLNCCFYLFGAAWQSLDIQALHLLGIFLSIRVIHLLLDLLR